ncbi:hypothetical protein ILUMI_20053 [Ignelater luminosus]|uniref:Protein takeout n=1 Tax=Ignelater luminosus TaxID=2038154 RepID=A0A8K0CLP2_IGNLU|nr:hypothetical protein ILUMI_20053 [Ignelater luminosus]
MLSSVVIFIIPFICLSVSNHLPSYLPRCYLDDPQRDECILRAFNKLRPNVANGIEEIGLPPLNPFVLPELILRQDTPNANFTIKVLNFTVAGLYKYDMKKFQYNPETKAFHFRIEYETIPITGDIEVSGHVASIPLSGKGFGRAVLGPVNATFDVKGNIKTSRGIDFYSTHNVKVDLDISDGSYYVEQLFNNNQTLVHLANEMLNANSVMVSEAVTPTLERLAEKGVKRFMKTLTRIPYYELFPLSR